MLWPAFLLGFLGSLHCVAMCSPIMLSIPWRGITSFEVLSKKLVYQAGRIGTYALIGMLLFLTGRRLLLGSIQQSIGLIIGISLVVYALMSLNKRFSKSSILTGVYLKLTRPFGQMLRSKTLASRFALGALNGLLPCGLVYVAAFTSLTQESVTDVALYMLAFGLGTLPMILGVFASGNFIKRRISKWSFNRLKPIVIVLMGMFFIVRSLELGIPFLSPVMEVAGTETSICIP